MKDTKLQSCSVREEQEGPLSARGAESNLSTSHTLTHQDPIPEQYLSSEGRVRSFDSPEHIKVELGLG